MLVGVVVAVLWLAHAQSADAKRVLMLPFPFTSHARQMVAVGEGLVDNGHEVYITLSESFPQRHLFENGKVCLLFYGLATSKD